VAISQRHKNRWDPTDQPRPSSLFSTPVHTFAQPFPLISIDAPNCFHYRSHQIEPESLKLCGSVSRAQLLNGGCGREIEPRSR
jgi:hypothetical protein